ncbi:MAG: hypothetical protein KBG82_03380 [Spirochaetes bacterium]|nr:hypothetical protein [Spirochaetota bacterium]HOV46444.1 adenylate/guanylate cyclase domain-containing protein [Exilispira sp.]
MNLKAKYIISFLIIYLIASVSLTVYLTNKNQETLIKQAKSNFESILIVIGRTIASPLVTFRSIKQDEIAINDARREILESKQKEQKFEDLKEILIFDKKGELAFPSALDTSLNKLTDKIMKDNVLNASIMDAFKINNSNFTDLRFKLGKESMAVLIYRVPFEWQQGITYPGYVATIISYDRIYKEQNAIRMRAVIINLLFLSFAVVFIWGLTLLLTKRIYIIIGAVKNLSSGQFTKIEPQGKDELESLMKEFNNMIDAIKERQLLGTYVSQNTIDMVKKSAAAEFDIEPSYQEYAIFFSDIRGFTSFSEQHDPKEVMDSLNKILDYQVGIIKKYNGDIDKFMGDSVMAIFKGDDKEVNALKAAYEIQKKWPFNGIYIGIGVAVGKVIVGNIGSSHRKEAAAIGDIVNTASRLCSHAKKKEIVISEETYTKARIQGFDGPEHISVKGKSAPIPVYKKLVE